MTPVYSRYKNIAYYTNSKYCPKCNKEDYFNKTFHANDSIICCHCKKEFHLEEDYIKITNEDYVWYVFFIGYPVTFTLSKFPLHIEGILSKKNLGSEKNNFYVYSNKKNINIQLSNFVLEKQYHKMHRLTQNT